MSWFKRSEKGIQTKTEEKKDIPKGLWYKTPTGKIIETQELEDNFFVSPEDEYHVRIGSEEYFKILFDDSGYKEINDSVTSVDFLNFTDTKSYSQRIKEEKTKSGLTDAVRTAIGKSKGKMIVIACMDFRFIGGSMGSVVGEKISKSILYAIENKIPLLIISKSGGARMMEGAFSLMQMAKISSFLNRLSEAKIPYISLCTDPTFGGTTASFAMLGDINISEPGALIGFAGPRVIEQTVREKLPDGFQRSEFLQEHGTIDMILERKNQPETIANILSIFGFPHEKKILFR